MFLNQHHLFRLQVFSIAPKLHVFILLIFIYINIYIEGLCSEVGEIKTRLVLSGDHKQLAAVTKSKNAKSLGFSMSFMEYLLDNKKCYQRHPKTKRFDPN